MIVKSPDRSILFRSRIPWEGELCNFMSLVECDIIPSEHVAYLTLNDPTHRNIISSALLDDFEACLNQLSTNQSVRVIVVRATGPVFSAGHDLNEIPDKNPYEVFDLLSRFAQTMRVMRAMPQIVIAEVSGIAAAAGCQLVAAADLAIAGDTALFSTPGVKIGLFCAVPSVYVARNVPRKKTAELLFTGEFISASDALESGLINHVVPAEKLAETTRSLAGRVARQSLSAIEATKRSLYA
ncbi:MAG: enoyl-CoA hydratase [Sulfobacillus benefaciens]|uniref:Enoyl-CoA hydratase n=1 Tax=Sulfobacillus benefaciens TaxID=453960 RepID=A0A2T2XCY4_9FIRM|nr:MAG: enoyl-CoA hydratase [Sulfobacillus benefaciens]